MALDDEHKGGLHGLHAGGLSARGVVHFGAGARHSSTVELNLSRFCHTKHTLNTHSTHPQHTTKDTQNNPEPHLHNSFARPEHLLPPPPPP